MAFDPNSPAQSHGGLSDITQIRTNLNALRNQEAATSQPANQVACMFWSDTASHRLKIKDEANATFYNMWDMTANKPIVANLNQDITFTMISSTCMDTAANTPALRSLGLGAQQAMAGNHVIPSLAFGLGVTYDTSYYPYEPIVLAIVEDIDEWRTTHSWVIKVGSTTTTAQYAICFRGSTPPAEGWSRMCIGDIEGATLVGSTTLGWIYSNEIGISSLNGYIPVQLQLQGNYNGWATLFGFALWVY